MDGQEEHEGNQGDRYKGHSGTNTGDRATGTRDGHGHEGRAWYTGGQQIRMMQVGRR